MTTTTTQTLAQDKFLQIAVNLLYKVFIEASRTRAKRTFAELFEGRRVALIEVEMEDKGQVRFDLTLDAGEFRGRLNFGAFKASVSMLVARAAEALQAQKNVPVFTAEGRDSHILFGVLGVTVEDGKANALALTADTGQAVGVAELRLMYLDPSQFAEGQQGVAAAKA